MTATQKLVGWVAFAVIVLVLIIASAPDRPRPEGHQGSYLGRTVDGQQAAANQVQQLNSRTAVQRF